MQISKKYLWPAIIVLLLLVAAAAAYFWWPQKTGETAQPPSTESAIDKPVVFMETAEKQALGLQPETKVQILGRDENGEIISYKIIRADEDILEGGIVPPSQPQAH